MSKSAPWTFMRAAYYLAGMIDGEGHVDFRRAQKHGRPNGYSRRIVIASTDRDLIVACEQCCSVLGLSYGLELIPERPPRKPCWRLVIMGKATLIRAARLLPIQSERKRVRLALLAESCVEGWSA